VPGLSEAQDGEIEKLRESLRLCQMELAAIRDDQETWMEQRSKLRRRRVLAEKRARVLSVALAERLASAPPSRGGRLARKVRRPAGTRTSELTRDEQLSMIRASDLFRPAFYLRNNLDVVEQGWEPAEHYLDVGASEGRKPGPDFDTTAYLKAHPEIVDQGVNPLVHFLRSRGRAVGRDLDR